jgi:hypothetical protein
MMASLIYAAAAWHESWFKSGNVLWIVGFEFTLPCSCFAARAANGNNAIWDVSRGGGRHLHWLSKAVRHVMRVPKFTGTAAHGEGGVLFLRGLLLHAHSQPDASFCCGKCKKNLKKILENFRQRSE